MPADDAPAPGTMELREELFELARQATAALPPLQVERVFVAHGTPAADRDAEFGLVSLDAGSAGLYYAWLGDSQAGMRARFDASAFTGVPALDLARLYLADSDAERSLGLAAISAITDALYRAAGYAPPAASDSLGGLALREGDRLGMVGNFPPLVRRARALGVRISIVERKHHMLMSEPGLEITLDPAVLESCDPIVCTGATLLNDSFDAVAGHCANASRIVLLGPTVGFFPDPVFARGVTAAGGTRVLDAERAHRHLAAGAKLGASAQRTLIERSDYPGFDTLLRRAAA